MKIIKSLFLGLILSCFSMHSQVAVNINLGTPPVWAPVDRVETQYYYLPDIDSYYDVSSSQFIYVRNGVWIRSTSLPKKYKTYNLKKGRIIYLTDYRGNKPYFYNKKHKIKYYKKTKIYNLKSKKGKGHSKSRGKGHHKEHKD